MKNFSVKFYQNNDYKDWNAFIGQAKNATFLFYRDFMEYHSDRFQDYSLIVLDGEKWVAVLPANVVGNEVFSHQGLTYGGLVYNEKLKLASVIAIFKSILSFLNANKMEKLQVKLLPSIYHQKPAEELNYALFLADAQLIRRDTLAVLDLSKKNSLSKLRKRSIQKGVSNDFEIKEVTDFEEFWNKILIPNLAQKHQAKPVHSLDEIIKLKGLFTGNIRQFNVYENGIIIAGTTIFETSNVAHCQYISGKEDKNELGGLDLLFQKLISETFKNKRFFDFGISNENQGRKLNGGLSYWKESFGASTIVHDFYEVETSNYSLLDTVLL
ncbi:GNAT family N-acetyltransferase [Flavobacterium franklandianum]|uniref:GNAT family N-acetyltransferase n=1 Tax=Flavobacterium franklandianum TaxID=2594430 RepID=A0A553C7Y3_9FLAO|nr:GNAT family N-acetyltransferase [Flavobacterium franklandianum]TRX16596.1 GNAT family N-acetyltransferase [Flavobacterium franklandianum]